jgi:hypothetical protein
MVYLALMRCAFLGPSVALLNFRLSNHVGWDLTKHNNIWHTTYCIAQRPASLNHPSHRLRSDAMMIETAYSITQIF